MNPILVAVIIVSATGLLLGLGLAIASKVMAVPVDETAEAIVEVLPGANCGACGFSGCAGYAAALSKGETKETNLCAPGGADVAKQVAKVLGMEGGDVTPMAAVVRCHGTCDNCDTMLDYRGVTSCKAATQLFGGQKDCNYGCLGFGDCVEACPYDAIKICNGVAVVNPLECRACKICIKTCPKNLIELVPMYKKKAVVLCNNQDKGAMTRKACKVGCIGCMKCVKTCPVDAITVKNNVAHVDYSTCIGCGKCVEGCPTHCLNLVNLGGKPVAKATTKKETEAKKEA